MEREDMTSSEGPRRLDSSSPRQGRLKDKAGQVEGCGRAG